jgi:hypothetical protein
MHCSDSGTVLLLLQETIRKSQMTRHRILCGFAAAALLAIATPAGAYDDCSSHKPGTPNQARCLTKVIQELTKDVAQLKAASAGALDGVRITWHPHWAPTRELCLYGVNEQSAPLFMTCDTEPPRSTFRIRK